MSKKLWKNDARRRGAGVNRADDVEAIDRNPVEAEVRRVSSSFQMENDVRQIAAYAAEVKSIIETTSFVSFPPALSRKAQSISDAAEKLRDESKIIQKRRSSAKSEIKIANIARQVGGKLAQIAEIYEQTYWIRADKRKEITDEVISILINDLGVNKQSAYEFAGRYSIDLAREIIVWFAAIPEDLAEGDVLDLAKKALETGDTSKIEKRFGIIPGHADLPQSLEAIIFIAESFKPKRETALEKNKNTGAKVSG